MYKIFSFIIVLMLCFFFSAQAQQLSSQPDPNGSSIVNDLVDVEIHYDGNHTQAVGGVNAQMIMAAKLTANLFTPYIGKELTKVKFYIQNAPVGNNVTVRIYAPGTAGAPGTELYSQAAAVDSQAWNTITLTTPFTVTGTDLWVAVQGICNAAPFWAGCDAGPKNANGQYIFWNGAWTTLTALTPTLTFNWNIRAIINNVVPVELTSFNANVSGNSVLLNWTTATETNNRGFEIQKKLVDGQFVNVGFVNGKGTTTEVQNYSFIDKVVPGTYSYRLRQVDFNGISDITKTVEVVISSPGKFELANNYPNPFNPSTKISFSLSVDSKVSLRVYNLLGQEVSSLVNGNLVSGSHEVNFNASKLSTGVYIYKLEAAGIDGQSFTSAKKMILNK